MSTPDEPTPKRRPFLGVAFGDVLDAARLGGGWALERLFQSFAGPVAAYLRTQGAEDPEGLANEVFLRVFNNIDRFDGGEDQFRSWLFTIAHHAMVDDRRRRSRRPDVADAEVPETTGPGADQAALDRLGTAGLLTQLDTLSPDQRDVLLLRFLADLTIDQIAAVTGKRAGAVKQLQRRGLAALRRQLEEPGGGA